MSIENLCLTPSRMRIPVQTFDYPCGEAGSWITAIIYEAIDEVEDCLRAEKGLEDFDIEEHGGGGHAPLQTLPDYIKELREIFEYEVTKDFLREFLSVFT
ncbi:MAG: hypothetical protein GY754_17770, partial [bacterium]|nr:hypothetical protein [bacterium]